jgi:hypothetical protein
LERIGIAYALQEEFYVRAHCSKCMTVNDHELLVDVDGAGAGVMEIVGAEGV